VHPAGTLVRAYGAKTTPPLQVIDAARTLVYMGGIDDRATTDPVTRPYGCSVEYRAATIS
jgi:hypothetical protein